MIFYWKMIGFVLKIDGFPLKHDGCALKNDDFYLKMMSLNVQLQPTPPLWTAEFWVELFVDCYFLIGIFHLIFEWINAHFPSIFDWFLIDKWWWCWQMMMLLPDRHRVQFSHGVLPCEDWRARDWQPWDFTRFSLDFCFIIASSYSIFTAFSSNISWMFRGYRDKLFQIVVLDRHNVLHADLLHRACQVRFLPIFVLKTIGFSAKNGRFCWKWCFCAKTDGLLSAMKCQKTIPTLGRAVRFRPKWWFLRPKWWCFRPK